MAAYVADPQRNETPERSGPPLLLWIGAAALAIALVSAAALLMPKSKPATQAQPGAVSQIAQDPQEESRWIDARQADTVSAYRAFLAAYPNSVHAAEAAWKSTPETRADVEAFLSRYPDSPQAEEARQALQSLANTERLADDDDWRQAEEIGAAGAYRRYLELHPRGAHAQEAAAKAK